jgi:hypothetical protein
MTSEFTLTADQTARAEGEAARAQAGQGAAQECAAIEADLERLKLLFTDAGDRLLDSFNRFAELARELSDRSDDRTTIDSALSTAVTALQFQDMATQLTGHAQRRLLALQAYLNSLSEDSSGLRIHPQPVRQAEMSAGSVDLF